jgi:nickel/cobalt transporter (NiCoT) family protein
MVEPRSGASRTLLLYALLVAGNLAAWAAALVLFHAQPVLLGTAFLAYSFGLRHGVDADHIAAIDNVTRKLMQQAKPAACAGFWFSLGHASVVIVASLALAAATSALEARWNGFRAVGAIIGTLVSAFFLFAVAVANIAILRAVWRSFRSVRRGGRIDAADLDRLLDKRGFWARLLLPAFRFVNRGWQMYPVGFLFGLGFDTATEVALLGIAASEAAKGLSLGAVLVFPLLFAAGMALVDTTDSVLMVGAYGWAFAEPLRKLYYNLTVTLVSVVVAVAVGGIEALGLVGSELHFDGPFWRLVAGLNDNFGGLGYAIIGMFLAAWLVSALFWRLRYAGTAG